MDYESGIEEMVLATLQQTKYSQQIELAIAAEVTISIDQAVYACRFFSCSQQHQSNRVER